MEKFFLLGWILFHGKSKCESVQKRNDSEIFAACPFPREHKYLITYLLLLYYTVSMLIENG